MYMYNAATSKIANKNGRVRQSLTQGYTKTIKNSTTRDTIQRTLVGVRTAPP